MSLFAPINISYSNTLTFFIVNQDQGSALKVAYIFKVFGAKSCLMTA